MMILQPSRFAAAGGGGAGAHRYWRVRGITYNGNPMGCAELELRTAIGGATVCTGGTAFASTNYDGSLIPSHAFDGNATDGHEWAASGINNEYIGYDFGAGNDKAIVEVRYVARQLFGVQSPNGAVLEYSDDNVTYTIAFEMRFGTFANAEAKVMSAPTPIAAGSQPHKYWRINFTTTSGGNNSGREGELRNVSGGPDLTDTLVAVYSDNGHFSTWGFGAMFDGDLNSLTAINVPGYGQAQFITPFSLEEFVWRARNGGGANYQVPLSGNVQYSDNGSAWTTYWEWEAPSWADDEIKTFTNPGPDASAYYRAIGTGDRTSIITLSATNITAGAGAPSALINGTQADTYWWSNATGAGTAWLKFDLVDKYAIDQFRWTQDVSNTHGVWRFEGSNDDSTYTQVGSDITLGPGTFNFSNTTSYRYYRLRHMSGSRSQTPFLREIEFRAGPPS